VIFTPYFNAPKIGVRTGECFAKRPALEGRCVEQSGASIWLRASSPARRKEARFLQRSFGRRPQVGLILSGLSPYWLLPICSLRLSTPHLYIIPRDRSGDCRHSSE